MPYASIEEGSDGLVELGIEADNHAKFDSERAYKADRVRYWGLIKYRDCAEEMTFVIHSQDNSRVGKRHVRIVLEVTVCGARGALALDQGDRIDHKAHIGPPRKT